MENTNFAVPYSDPYDPPLLHPNLFDITNPAIEDILSNINGPIAAALPQQQQHNHFGLQHANSGNVPITDPMVQDQFVHTNNLPIGGEVNFQPGPSSRMQLNHTQPAVANFGSQVYDEVVPLFYWPETPKPFFCSCCYVLREIIHTNGTNFEKLEIHGSLGRITHAIHHQNITQGNALADVQFKMIDFSNKSIEDVKNFLVMYCEEHNSTGYILIQDPLTSYYEAICTGMDWIEEFGDNLGDFNANNSANEMEEVENGASTPKPNLAVQRERAGKTKLKDFSDYFHLPIEEASKRVNLCPTVVKKICRKAGLQRWPFRKVKSIAKQMVVLLKAAELKDPLTRARSQVEISRLEQEMVHHCGGIAPTALDIFSLAET